MENPEQARQFIRDLCRIMRERAWEENDVSRQTEQSDSMQKRMYGDTWTFFYGIQSGIDKMRQGKDTEYDFEKRERVDHGASDRKWKEHYDKYGYGVYGRGLKIGKRLAFYTGTNFTFSKPEHDESESESKFTFTQ